MRMDIGLQASVSRAGGVTFDDSGTTKYSGRMRERKRLPLMALIVARSVKRKPEDTVW